MLELLADIFRVLMWCAILLTVLWHLTTLAFVVFDFNDMRRMWPVAVDTLVLWAIPTAVAAFLLKLVSELIRLFINVAQDNERLVRLSEAELGKPWAPK